VAYMVWRRLGQVGWAEGWAGIRSGGVSKVWALIVIEYTPFPKLRVKFALTPSQTKGAER